MTRRSCAALAALFVSFLTSCGQPATAPEETAGPATAMELVSGAGQADTVLSTLPRPLIVRVLDARGKPVPGASVGWVAAAEGGRVEPASSVTDADGLARATWTLGTRAGSWKVVASGFGSPVEFTATARAGAAASFALMAGTTPLGIGVRRKIATARDAHGNDASASLLSTSLDTAVVLASDSGFVQGVRAGIGRVVVSSGAIIDTAWIRVVPSFTIALGMDFGGNPLPDTAFNLPTAVHPLPLRISLVTSAPLASLSYSFDGGPDMPITRATNTFAGGELSIPSTGPVNAGLLVRVDLPLGQHELKVTAVDVAGNVATARHAVGLRSQARRYTLRFLEIVNGTDSQAADLNERGDVAGSITGAGGQTRAVLWRDGRLVELGAGLPGSTRVVGVNDAQQVVGVATDGCERTFVWEGGSAQLLPGCRTPLGIATDGAILLSDEAVWSRGVVWPLPPRPSGGAAFPRTLGMNRAGTVFGVSYVCGGGFCSGPTWLIRSPWSAGDLTSLSVSGALYTDLNERGDLVGTCIGGSGGTCNLRLRLADGTTYAFDWPTRGSASFIAINNNRQAIGNGFGGRGFVWEAGSLYRIEPTDPNWTVDRVVEINDAGQIAAHAVNTATGRSGAVLLTPAP